MTYEEARAEAQARADATGLDHGIEDLSLRGYRDPGFRVFVLPRRENRYGFELRCEVVSSARPRSGHGAAR